MHCPQPRSPCQCALPIAISQRHLSASASASSRFLIHPLRQRFGDSAVKLGGVRPGKRNFLPQVVREHLYQLAVTVFVQLRFVCELDVFVAVASIGALQCQLEMQGCRTCQSLRFPTLSRGVRLTSVPARLNAVEHVFLVSLPQTPHDQAR